MGLSKFKKLFIEDDSKDLNDVESFLKEYSTNVETTEPVVEVNCDTSDVVQISSIYEGNGMMDFESSIFKIDEIRNVLPNDLTKEAKKESVLGMMKVTGLSLETILLDADKRKKIISVVGDTFAAETKDIIEESNAEIAELEERINNLKAIITERKKAQEQQEEILVQEINRIDEIVNFIK